MYKRPSSLSAASLPSVSSLDPTASSNMTMKTQPMMADSTQSYDYYNTNIGGTNTLTNKMILLLATLFVAVQADGKAQYKFELEVHDHHGGGVQRRTEERHGDSTKGEYTISGKDGTKTKVQYSVYGHHHGHHEGNHGHYNEGQSGHFLSGHQGEQGFQSSEGHGSSSSSLGSGIGSGGKGFGYHFQQGLSSLHSKSNGYHTAQKTSKSEEGASGYQFGHGLSGGLEGYSAPVSSKGETGSFEFDSKHGYESEKSFGSHSNILGSSSYKPVHESSSYFSDFGSGKNSGYLASLGSGSLKKNGYYSGESGGSSRSNSFDYKYGHGSEQDSFHYSKSSGLGSENESKSKEKQQEAHSSSSYQAGHEVKLPKSSPSFSGYAEQYKNKFSYKPLYYKTQLYHQTEPSHSVKPKYEQESYKTQSQGKYDHTEAKTGSIQSGGYSGGAYKGSGDAKSYYNFITYESGQGGHEKNHHKNSYHQSSEQDSYHKNFEAGEGSSQYHSSKGGGYKAESEENKGSYGSYQYKYKYPAPIPVKAEDHKYTVESAGKGYKYETSQTEDSKPSLGTYGNYEFKSKHVASKPIHPPAVHEEKQYESLGYSSDKGGYHYYGSSESNDGQKSGYSSFKSFPSINQGSSKEEYASTFGGLSKFEGGYSLYPEEEHITSEEGFEDEISSKDEYASSLEAFWKAHGGYGSSPGVGSSFSGGYDSFKGGSSLGGFNNFHTGASQEDAGSSSEGFSSSKEGYESSLGGFEKFEGGYDFFKGDNHSSPKEGEGSSKEGAASHEEYSSKGSHSSGYSSGGEATSRVKLHTRGADVETLTKHIIPPKYHENK